MAPTSPLVLAALLGPTLASAAFIFDASQCNTNWDSAANWEGNAVPASTSLVSFGSSSRVAGTPIEPANLLIKPGTYSVGGFVLPRHGAAITLARDGATINMPASPEGPAAYFTGGQTDKKECAFGCPDNWKMGTPEQAADPSALQTLPQAIAIPGIDDMAVVPFGYNPKISAWGLHAVGGFGWYSTDGTLRWATSKDEIPQAFTVPEGRMLDLFFDSDEAEYRCNGPCSVESRCPAWSGEVANDVNRPFEQAARTRTDAESRAAGVVDGTVRIEENRFSFNFGVGTLAWSFSSAACISELGDALTSDSLEDVNSTTTVNRALLPLGSVVSGVSVTSALGAITVTGTIEGPAFHMQRVRLSESATYPFTAATFDAQEGRLFYAIFDGMANYFGANTSCATFGDTADIKASAGLVRQSLTVYAGALSPQMDLPYLIDSANKDSLADALATGLSGSNGITSLNLPGLNAPPSLTIVGTADQHQAVRGPRSLAHLDMVNYNTGQALIQLNLEFQAYGQFAGTHAAVAVRTLADVILTNQAIVWPAAQNCLRLPAGYDWTCVTDRINATVETAMASPATGSDCDTLGYLSDECRAEATAAAAADWDLMFMCGPLGNHVDGVSGCVDPMYSTSGALFVSASEGAIAGQEAAITSASAGSDDDGFLFGFSMLQVIAAAAAVLLICVIVVAVVVLKSGSSDAEKQPRQAATVAFENPMYEQTAGMPGDDGLYDNGAAPGDDLYDEPEIVTKGNPVYGGDDDEGDTAGMYAEGGAVAGGYLDMDPDDGDDDDDDGEEESEEDDEDDEDDE
jgi:hypothetical protein